MSAKPCCRGRLVSDPSIRVSDLTHPLTAFIAEQGSSDLDEILHIPQQSSFKTAVIPAWLCHLSPLLKDYVKVAPNTLIPPKRHRLALAAIHAKQPLHRTKKGDSDKLHFFDEKIRVALAQIRTLAQSPALKARAFRQSSPIQVERIEEVLKLVDVSVEAEGDSQQSQQTPSPTPKTSTMETSPATPRPSASRAATHESGAGVVQDTTEDEKCDDGRGGKEGHLAAGKAAIRKPSQSLCLADVPNLFESILAQDSDVEDVPKFETPQRPAPALKRSNAGSPNHFSKILEGDDGDDDAISKDDMELLRGAVETLPIGLNGESQLVIFKNHGGKTKKDKVKQAAKTKKKAKTSKKLGKANAGKAQPAKLAKKGSGSQDIAKKQDDRIGQPHSVPTTRIRSKRQLHHGDGEAHQPKGGGSKGKNMCMSRAARRRRVVSRAWHTTYDKGIKEGLDDETARTNARQAHKDAANEFDSLEPLASKKASA